MKLYQAITVDLFNLYPLPKITAQQNNVGRGVLITLTANGEILMPTDESVRIFSNRPDKYVSYLDCVITTDGRIQADFTDQMLSAVGQLEVELQFTTESTNITTPIFIVEVQESNIKAAVESSDEFKALETFVKEAETSMENANKYATAAEQSMNNAQIYATAAEDSVNNSKEYASDAWESMNSAQTYASNAEKSMNSAQTSALDAEESMNNTKRTADAIEGVVEECKTATKSANEAAQVVEELIENGVQSDWNEMDSTSATYINNRPNIKNGTTNSISLGQDSVAGAMGYYILGIEMSGDTDDVVQLVLSEQQVQSAPPVDMRDNYNTSQMEEAVISEVIPQFESGDEIYIVVPNNHYTFCGVASSLRDNRLSVQDLRLLDQGTGKVDKIFNLNDLIKLWIEKEYLDESDNGITFQELKDQGLIGQYDYMVCIPKQPLWGRCEVTTACYAEGKLSCAVGDYSHAEGYGNVATGAYGHAEGYGSVAGYASHAEGRGTEAKGRYSHTEGQSTVATGHTAHAEGGSTFASGDKSHSEGYYTIASGIYSHVEGYYTQATADSSHAEGKNTTASGDKSHAEGRSTQATADSSHAEGYYTIASGLASHAECRNTRATGDSAHAEGKGTTASGNYSHAEGIYSAASGSESHAEGCETTASGYSAHSEGAYTKATATCTHAEGTGTVANCSNQHVQGRYNVENNTGTYAHIVGNGTSDTSRSNAHTLDWKGNAWYKSLSLGGNFDAPKVKMEFDESTNRLVLTFG